jgi:hypothetical protein
LKDKSCISGTKWYVFEGDKDFICINNAKIIPSVVLVVPNGLWYVFEGDKDFICINNAKIIPSAI